MDNYKPVVTHHCTQTKYQKPLLKYICYLPDFTIVRPKYWMYFKRSLFIQLNKSIVIPCLEHKMKNCYRRKKKQHFIILSSEKHGNIYLNIYLIFLKFLTFLSEVSIHHTGPLLLQRKDNFFPFKHISPALLTRQTFVPKLFLMDVAQWPILFINFSSCQQIELYPT